MNDLVEFFGQEMATSLGAFIHRLYKEYVAAPTNTSNTNTASSTNNPNLTPSTSSPKKSATPSKTATIASEEKKNVPQKRHREDTSGSPADASASTSTSSTTSSRRPDQARFIPGVGSKLTAPSNRDVVVGGGRVAPQRGGRGVGIGSVVLVSRATPPAATGETESKASDDAQPASKRRQILRKAGDDEEQQPQQQTSFHVTFNPATNEREPAKSTPPTASASAKPKRVLVTKAGKELVVNGNSPSVTSTATTTTTTSQQTPATKLIKRHAASTELVEQIKQGKIQSQSNKQQQQQQQAPAPSGKRQFGNGFPTDGHEQQKQQPKSQQTQQQQQQQITPQESTEQKQPQEQKQLPIVVKPRNKVQQQVTDEADGMDLSSPPPIVAEPTSAFRSTFNAQSTFATNPSGSQAFVASTYKNPNLTRCRFFPACTNSSCPFVHPTKLCASFPHCTAGEACLDLHPALPCRYGEACTNPACSFTHPPSTGGVSAFRGGRGGSTRGRGGRGGAFNRGGSNVANGGVGLDGLGPEGLTSHPRGALSRVPMRGRGGLTNMLKLANTPCRYGQACTREDW